MSQFLPPSSPSLPGGYVASYYDNSGTIIICRIDGKQLSYFPNDSIILSKRIVFPYVVSFHKGGCLQIIDVEKRQCRNFQVESLNKETNVCVLISDHRLILATTKKILVFGKPSDDCENWREITLTRSQRPLTNIVDETTFLITDGKILLGSRWAFEMWEIEGEGTKKKNGGKIER